MKAYFAIFRTRLIAGMQYRAAAWAGVATQFFWGGIQILIFFAFYESAGLYATDLEAPMSFSHLTDFIWMRQAFLALVMLWSMDNELLEHIVSGNVAYELSRPMSLYTYWFSRIIAFRISRTLLRCFPIFFIAFFLPAPFGFSLPPGIIEFLLFVISMVLAVMLVTSLSMIVCYLTFVSMSPLGARLLIGTIGEFLMGGILPIPFMPFFLQRIIFFLPFRYTADFPFRIYSGSIGMEELLPGFLMQISWLLILVLLGNIAFNSRLKRLVIQGG